MTDRPRHTISSSDGTSLHLTDAEYREYKREERELILKYYKLEVERRGYWASNQDRYVSSPELFNPYDSTYMVELLKETGDD